MLDDILIFISVVDNSSFSKAAEILKIQKSTVSKRIAHLEERLSNLLFIRDTRNLTVTEYGQHIYDKFCHLPSYVQDSLRLDEDSAVCINEDKDELNIALGAVISYELICPYLTQFNNDHPNTKLNIIFDANINECPDNGIDIALAPKYLKGNGLENTFLRTEFGQLFCTKEYAKTHKLPQEPEDLKFHTILGTTDVYNNPMNFLKLKNNSSRKEYIVDLSNSLIKINNAIHMKKIGMNSNTIFGCFKALLKKELENGSVVEVLPEWTLYQIDYYIVHKKNCTKIELEFVKFITKCINYNSKIQDITKTTNI